ncbi:MAG TPA: hypothetical protein VNA14_10435 [Mycobacteriales bacterium]|nr:hypothetical protein [Mycobacteriales bacterium]
MSRSRRALLVVALLLVATTACSSLGSLVGTTSQLEKAGYDDVSIHLATTPAGERVDLSYQGVDDSVEFQRAKDAALIVWTELEIAFDAIAFFVDGSSLYAEGELTFSRPELIGFFGPRPAGISERRLEDEFVSGAKNAVRVVAGLFAGLVGVGIVAVLLVRRSRRNRPAASAYGYDPSNPFAPPQPGTAGSWSPGPVVPAAPPPGDPNDPWAPPPR